MIAVSGAVSLFLHKTEPSGIRINQHARVAWLVCFSCSDLGWVGPISRWYFARCQTCVLRLGTICRPAC